MLLGWCHLLVWLCRVWFVVFEYSGLLVGELFVWFDVGLGGWLCFCVWVVVGCVCGGLFVFEFGLGLLDCGWLGVLTSVLCLFLAGCCVLLIGYKLRWLCLVYCFGLVCCFASRFVGECWLWL